MRRCIESGLGVRSFWYQHGQYALKGGLQYGALMVSQLIAEHLFGTRYRRKASSHIQDTTRE